MTAQFFLGEDQLAVKLKLFLRHDAVFGNNMDHL